MVVINEKSHAEYYCDRLMPRPLVVEPNLPAKDFTAGTPCVICPSRFISEAIEYHDLGLMGKLTDKLTAWLRKHAD